jgi:hypothetical protein
MLPGCAPAPVAADKIGFDLSALDAEGLRGTGSSRRSVHYEFCIPAGASYVETVRAIDRSAEPMPGSRGRIGCGTDETLVVGTTHQPGYVRVLTDLAGLDWIRRIEEAHFE